MDITAIMDINKPMLTCADVAPFLGFDPNSLRLQAREDPSLLGFPVVVAGTRVQIPKEGFINYIKYGRIIMLNPDEELKYGGVSVG